MATLNPTIREQIIRELVASLEAMPGELRGLQDWRGVYRGKTGFDPEELPAITVLPGMESAAKAQFGRHSLSMDISVQALFPTAMPAVVGGQNVSELGEAILGALIFSVASEDTTSDALAGLTDAIAYSSGGIAEYPDETEQVTIVEARFSIKYRTALGDPYNQ